MKHNWLRKWNQQQLLEMRRKNLRILRVIMFLAALTFSACFLLVGFTGNFDGPAQLPNRATAEDLVFPSYASSLWNGTFPLSTTCTSATHCYTPSTSGTNANRGAALQASLNSAVADCSSHGSMVVIPAGFVYDAVGQSNGFVVKPTNCDGSHRAILQTDHLSSLHPQGTRISITDAQYMPTLTNTTANGAILDVADSPTTPNRGVWIAGLEVKATVVMGASNFYTNDGIMAGDNCGYEYGIDSACAISNGNPYLPGSCNTYPTVNCYAGRVTIDRSYIHAGQDPISNTDQTSQELVHAVYWDAADFVLHDSIVHAISVNGKQSNALSSDYSFGPSDVQNNEIEGYGEGMITGADGGDAGVTWLQSDYYIAFNHFFKPTAWLTLASDIRSQFECKGGQRFLLEGNVSENNPVYRDYLLFPAVGKSQWGCLDFTIRYNKANNTTEFLEIGGPGVNSTGGAIATKRVSVHDNVIEHLSNTWMGNGQCVGGNPPCNNGVFLELEQISPVNDPSLCSTTGTACVISDVSIVHNTVASNDNTSGFKAVLSLNGPTFPITGMTRASNVVTATFPYAVTVPGPITVSACGACDSSFNGTFTVASGAGTQTLTWNQTGSNSTTATRVSLSSISRNSSGLISATCATACNLGSGSSGTPVNIQNVSDSSFNSGTSFYAPMTGYNVTVTGSTTFTIQTTNLTAAGPYTNSGDVAPLAGGAFTNPLATGDQMYNIAITDNMFPPSFYYASGNGPGVHPFTTPLNWIFGGTSQYTFDKNILTGLSVAGYSTSDFPSPICNFNNVAAGCTGGSNPGWVSSLSAAGLVNLNSGSGGDYHLCFANGVPPTCAAASPYMSLASDGLGITTQFSRSPGADVDAVNQITASTLTGQPTIPAVRETGPYTGDYNEHFRWLQMPGYTAMRTGDGGGVCTGVNTPVVGCTGAGYNVALNAIFLSGLGYRFWDLSHDPHQLYDLGGWDAGMLGWDYITSSVTPSASCGLTGADNKGFYGTVNFGYSNNVRTAYDFAWPMNNGSDSSLIPVPGLTAHTRYVIYRPGKVAERISVDYIPANCTLGTGSNAVTFTFQPSLNNDWWSFTHAPPNNASRALEQYPPKYPPSWNDNWNGDNTACGTTAAHNPYNPCTPSPWRFVNMTGTTAGMIMHSAVAGEGCPATQANCGSGPMVASGWTTGFTPGQTTDYASGAVYPIYAEFELIATNFANGGTYNLATVRNNYRCVGAIGCRSQFETGNESTGSGTGVSVPPNGADSFVTNFCAWIGAFGIGTTANANLRQTECNSPPTPNMNAGTSPTYNPDRMDWTMTADGTPKVDFTLTGTMYDPVVCVTSWNGTAPVVTINGVTQAEGVNYVKVVNPGGGDPCSGLLLQIINPPTIGNNGDVALASSTRIVIQSGVATGGGARHDGARHQDGKAIGY